MATGRGADICDALFEGLHFPPRRLNFMRVGENIVSYIMPNFFVMRDA